MSDLSKLAGKLAGLGAQTSFNPLTNPQPGKVEPDGDTIQGVGTHADPLFAFALKPLPVFTSLISAPYGSPVVAHPGDDGTARWELGQADELEDSWVDGLLLDVRTDPVSGRTFAPLISTGRVNFSPEVILSLVGTDTFVPGAIYYLSAATPGKLTTIEPSNPNFIVKVGKAIGSETLLVAITAPVQAGGGG